MDIIKNEDYEILIEDMTVNGEGVGKIDGYALFVKDAVIGDRIIAKVIKTKKHYGYGRLMSIIEPSIDRVNAKCPVAKACGGCTLMAMSYEAQLEFKNKIIAGNLSRIGGLTDITLPPVIGMEEPYRYRNKAQFPVGKDKNGNIVMGFYAGHSHSIVPCEDCLIGSEYNAGILAKIKEYMVKYHIEPYNEELHNGKVRHVLIREGYTTGEIMVCLVINGTSLKHEDELVKMLKTLTFTRDRKIASIMLNYNTDKTNVILGNECRLLEGKPYIEDYIGDIRYQISPLSFYQVNPVQTRKLYELALEYAGLTGNETVWDLYCGIGTISLFLAQKAKKVYGVEIIPQAIENAKNNAIINGITNAEFYVGKAEEVLPKKYEEEQVYAEVIVVDPPRKGCDETLLDTMVKMKPERIVYVSCDSATLARDLKYLVANGYEVKKVQGVDQFGHSGHVETVVLLSQRKPDDVIEVELELDELDITASEKAATYQQIKDYIMEKYGVKVHTSYIAQTKRKYGFDMRENYNKSKKENPMVKQCTEEKEKYIVEALEHFAMLRG